MQLSMLKAYKHTAKRALVRFGIQISKSGYLAINELICEARDSWDFPYSHPKYDEARVFLLGKQAGRRIVYGLILQGVYVPVIFDPKIKGVVTVLGINMLSQIFNGSGAKSQKRRLTTKCNKRGYELFIRELERGRNESHRSA